MIDMDAFRLSVANSIRMIVGDDLSQQQDPDTLEFYGTVLNKRPAPKAPIPDYPYALLDILNVRDLDGYLQNTYYDPLRSGVVYETLRVIDIQISIYGGDAIQIASKLDVGYRRPDVIGALKSDGNGLYMVEPVQNLPEMYDTNYVERAVFIISFMVCDTEVDTTDDYGSFIDTINTENTLEHYQDDEAPIILDVSATVAP